jgi:hypothetical protein
MHEWERAGVSRVPGEDEFGPAAVARFHRLLHHWCLAPPAPKRPNVGDLPLTPLTPITPLTCDLNVRFELDRDT